MLRSRERRHRRAVRPLKRGGSLEASVITSGWRESREGFVEAVAFCVTSSQNQGSEGKEHSTTGVCGHLYADRL